jgi:endogenous inhibitor of DNA gyrase (YacG/DUF329 family)
MKPPRVVSCPHCGAPVEWKADNRFRPFCSERCKVMDLGAWANEQYRVAGEPAPVDADTDTSAEGT